jgi:fission 1 protein
MPTELPYAIDAETPLEPEELEVLRTQYYKEIEQGHVTTQSKFNYGERPLFSSSLLDRLRRYPGDLCPSLRVNSS